MKEAAQLKNIISQSIISFGAVSEEEWDYKPQPERWSKKEILGHLCDSAMNNIRRFVVSQYEQNNKIVYKQNEWVSSQSYQDVNCNDIIALWKLLNEQAARIIDKIPADKLQNTCITDTERTLQFLIEDYIAHLNHHLSQILN